MHIECNNNNGVPYLRLCTNVKTINDKGKTVYRKKTLLNIGSLSKFDDGQPDYLNRLRESFKLGMPLINSLLPFVESEPIYKIDTINNDLITLQFKAGTNDCIGEPKIFSHTLLDSILSQLGLTELLTLIKHRQNIEYDILGLFRLLVFGGILNPSSKQATFYQNNDYFQNLSSCENKYKIYELLTLLHENKSSILKRMNSSISKTIGRETSTIFYDVTNFYFEIDYPDEDTMGLFDVVHTGLRKKGVSKENSNNPIIQMGLFMDDNGIPISFEMFSGNTLDQATFRPAISKTVDNYDISKFILVADRGIMSFKNIAHLLSKGNGFIISKSIKKSQKKDKEWILNQNGYIDFSDDFKYKSKVVTRTIEDEAGEKKAITYKMISYWSRKFYEKEAREHSSFLKFIEELRENPNRFRITNSQLRFIKKIMKKDVMNIKTGEIIRSSDLIALIDEEKVEEFTKYYGYYQIVTSELEMDDLEVINKYRGLSKIEDQFKTLKSNINIRPFFVSSPQHIDAHLIVCMIALTILKLIQYKMVKEKAYKVIERNKGKEVEIFKSLSVERIITALNKWQIEELVENHYRFNNIKNTDLNLIFKTFKIQLEPKLYNLKELKSLKKTYRKL